MPAIRSMAEYTRSACALASLSRLVVFEHVIHVICRQVVVFDVLDVPAGHRIPNDVGPFHAASVYHPNLERPDQINSAIGWPSFRIGIGRWAASWNSWR